MLKPVNGHLLIEPEVHESFIQSNKATYEEIGTVVDYAPDLQEKLTLGSFEKGFKVYFDAWLAVRYPKAGGKEGDFYWLVKWEHVRAIETSDAQS